MSIKRWDWTHRYFLQNTATATKDFCCILLNCPIALNLALFEKLWNSAPVRICADGGANVLFELQQKSHLSHPTHIIGDLDSARETVLEHYHALKKCNIIQDSNDSNTDFDKCLDFIIKSNNDNSNDNDDNVASRVFVFGAMGGEGRFDQTFANIHSCYSHDQKLEICLFSDKSYAFLLGPDVIHEIHVDLADPKDKGKDCCCFDGPTCGLLPFLGETRVTTKGLVWELDGDIIKFGGLFSSSNGFKRDVVRIETDKSILFTIEINSS